MNEKAPHTQGEALFEEYLHTQGIAFEFERKQAGKSRVPDYEIEWGGKQVYLDVKDFDAVRLAPGSGAFDPYPRIREKVEQGRDKFREYKEFCCALVLCNLGNPFVMLQHPDVVLGAMYGDSGFTFPINIQTGIGDAGQLKPAFLGRGKMIRPKRQQPQNTTISALITLSSIKPDHVRLAEMIRARPDLEISECEAEVRRVKPDFDMDISIPRVIVWHSAVARIPFPTNLFCGEFDTHFGVLVDEEGNINQEVTFRGNALPESVKV